MLMHSQNQLNPNFTVRSPRSSAQQVRGIYVDRAPHHQNRNEQAQTQMRSLSKKKQRLRSHLFKHKNLIKENQIFSPENNYLEKYYSYYGGNKNNCCGDAVETKSSLKTFTDQQSEVETIKINQMKKSAELGTPKQKNERKEFKLIGQIKKQKLKNRADRVQIRIKAEAAKSERENERNSKISSQDQKQFVEQNTGLLNVQQLHQMGKSVERSQGQTSLQKQHSVLASQNTQFSKKLNKHQLTSSLTLELESKIKSKLSYSMFSEQLESKLLTTLQKVERHLSILQTLSNFVKESIKLRPDNEEWEKLDFLIYKKYYIQRVKVLNFLRKFPMKNPFNIYNAEISSKQVIQFMKTIEGNDLQVTLQAQNKRIKQKLQNYYSQFSKSKVGDKINLSEYDNFSHWLTQQMWAELIMTEYDASHTKQVINIRLYHILQSLFLITELNGNLILSFEEGENVFETKEYQYYIEQGKNLYEKYIFSKQY